MNQPRIIDSPHGENSADTSLTRHRRGFPFFCVASRWTLFEVSFVMFLDPITGLRPFHRSILKPTCIHLRPPVSVSAAYASSFHHTFLFSCRRFRVLSHLLQIQVVSRKMSNTSFNNFMLDIVVRVLISDVR